MTEVATSNQGAPAAADGAVGEQAQPQQSFWSVMKGLVTRGLIIYFITSWFSKRGAGPADGGSGGAVQGGKAAVPASNLYSDAAAIDLYSYLSEREVLGDSFPTHLLWRKTDLVYGDWTAGPDGDGCHYHTVSFDAPESVINNGSLWMHMYVVPHGGSPNPQSKRYTGNQTTVHSVHRLNKYMKYKYRKTANLLTGQTEKSDEEIRKAETIKEEIISHWHQNITINMVHDFTQWIPGSVPPPLDSYMEFTAAQDRYKPILFANNYWCLVKDYQPINDTVKTLNLTITFQPLGMMKWQMYATQLSKTKMPGMLGALSAVQEEDEDQDAMKEALLETNPAFLIFTAIASILHTVFEMLAFKNDIQFWNNRQSLEGLSVRSQFFNVFQALLVLLYVFDNETNFLIKMSCFMELGIQIWKVTKVKDVRLNWEKRIMGIPTLTFVDKESYTKSDTDKYDKMAFKYVGWGLFPLLAIYVVYSLVYYEHKGWYSFTLSMLYGFLLTFGFIKMTPQLFINYKMKSVAHLPWRMLTYKAINTFIDDIFAFVIKMPTMYRLGCLRDDIIFFIFLYQRYIYRIDPKRVNEFGFSQEDLEKKDGGAPASEDTPSIEEKSPELKKEE